MGGLKDLPPIHHSHPFTTPPEVVEQVPAADLDGPAILQILCRVLSRQQNAPGAPGELVSEGVVVRVGRGQAAAVRFEADHSSAPSMYGVDDLHGRHVINARIEPELVQ